MVTARRILLSLVVAIGVVGIAWAFASNPSDPQVHFVTGVEGVYPPSGALDVRQVRIGIDLAPGYTGVLQVDGVEIPEDQLDRVDPLNQIFYTPGVGKETGRLSPGRHCATALFWRVTETRASARSTEWCFGVH